MLVRFYSGRRSIGHCADGSAVLSSMDLRRCGVALSFLSQKEAFEIQPLNVRVVIGLRVRLGVI